MKIMINILSIFLFSTLLNPSWSDTYDKGKLFDASESLVKKGMPEIVKKVAVVVTVGAFSTKAKAEYDGIEGKENNTSLENASIVVNNIYDEEQEKIKAIASDVETIYNFGVKPGAKIAIDTTVKKSEELESYYEKKLKPELEKKYEEALPIVNEKIEESKKYATRKWEEAEPIIEEQYENLKEALFNILK